MKGEEEGGEKEEKEEEEGEVGTWFLPENRRAVYVREE
jgi:hypothetical protein